MRERTGQLHQHLQTKKKHLKFCPGAPSLHGDSNHESQAIKSLIATNFSQLMENL